MIGKEEEKRIQKGQKKGAPWTDQKKGTKTEKDGKKKKTAIKNVTGREEETKMQRKGKMRRVVMKEERDTGAEVKRVLENMTGVKRDEMNVMAAKRNIEIGREVKTGGKKGAARTETEDEEKTGNLRGEEKETNKKDETPAGTGGKREIRKIGEKGEQKKERKNETRTRNTAKKGIEIDWRKKIEILSKMASRKVIDVIKTQREDQSMR